MGNEYCSPAERIESLLEEREQYIEQQEQVRQERMEIELQLLLLMIDEWAAKDPRLDARFGIHVGKEGLPSFTVLYKKWGVTRL